MWVLVGLKRDARADEARRDTCISNDEAYAFAQAHGAVYRTFLRLAFIG